MPTPNPDFLAATALAEKWGESGWTEYLLWDVIQGYREKPCTFLPGLTEEEMALLERLRDKHKIWFHFMDEKWEPVDIIVWSAHTANLRADDVCRKIESER